MAKKQRVKSIEDIKPIPIDRIPIEVAKETKYTGKPTEQVIETLIDELEAMLIQRQKEVLADNMRIAWETGQMLRNAEKLNKVSVTSLVARVAMDNRISGRHMGERSLWFAIKFYDTFPNFESVYDTEFGEAISLTKIKKMLIAPKPKKNKTLQEMAYDIVEKMGADQALKLVQEIEKEVKRRETKSA